jgi:hypothetical protein
MHSEEIASQNGVTLIAVGREMTVGAVTVQSGTFEIRCRGQVIPAGADLWKAYGLWEEVVTAARGELTLQLQE